MNIILLVAAILLTVLAIVVGIGIASLKGYEEALLTRDRGITIVLASAFLAVLGCVVGATEDADSSITALCFVAIVVVGVLAGCWLLYFLPETLSECKKSHVDSKEVTQYS